MVTSLRIDIDLSYAIFKKTREFFEWLWEFILTKMGYNYLGYHCKASSNGNTHCWVFIEEQVDPPYKYFLEVALGGDLNRAWFNFFRWKTMHRDIDIMFTSKRGVPVKVKPYCRWPGEWFWQ